MDFPHLTDWLVVGAIVLLALLAVAVVRKSQSPPNRNSIQDK
jgi:hypothetical protein